VELLQDLRTLLEMRSGFSSIVLVSIPCPQVSNCPEIDICPE
jgi:hypothetical protein